MVKFTLSALLFASAFAGAQTVTLGTTTSTQSGSTTTITLPVTVAVPASSGTVAAQSLATLRVEASNGAYGSSVGQTFGRAFKTVALPNVITDTAAGWNASTNTYTVPATGTYLITSNVRLVDWVPAGVSYGQGVNTTNVDNPYFLWTTTGSPRNGFSNTRIMQLSAGQTVVLFAFIDSPSAVAISGAALNIQQIN